MSGRRAKYLPNSRKPDVENSVEWISSSEDLVLCIHGPAGVGKSTLVAHLSDELRSAGQLAASAFIGAFSPDTSGPETIIKTLAHEIGSIHPRAISKIVEAINQCHATSLENQLEGYILKPLRLLNHPEPLVIIVDAVDEWRDHPPFIEALAHLNSETAVVKFIITSRLDPHTSRLRGIERISSHSYPLRPVPQEVVKDYFNHHFESIDWDHRRKPSDRQVDQLAGMSGGLLVWGATVCSLLSHKFSDFTPHEILSGILAEEQKVGSTEQLAQLYRDAIIRLFPSVEDQKRLRSYLGATMVLQEALPAHDFCLLVGMRPHVVASIRSTLSALQTRLPPTGSSNMIHPASTLFHLSFLDYIQAAPAENVFAISMFDCHAAVGLPCLNQIITLPPPLSNQTSSSPLHPIQRYAIKHWPHHVSHGTHRSHDEWVKTPHCSTLNTIPIDVQRQWAALFLNMLLPEAEVVVTEEQDMPSILTKIGDSLGEDGGERWVFEVACLEVAVRLGPGCYEAWCNLGLSYKGMGKRTGSAKMYEESVVASRHALELLPASHPERPQELSLLGNALWSLYECNGDVNALNESISHHRDALALWPAAHSERYASLINLGSVLGILFERNGDRGALNESISHLRGALALLPASHPSRQFSLNNLGNALKILFDASGDIKPLNESISHYRDALALQPAPHRDRSMSLVNLGNALRCLFDRNDDLNALKESISHFRDALALRPTSHPGRPSSLINLGSALLSLFGHNGDLNALNESISHFRNALAVLPIHHPGRVTSLGNLGNALRSLYGCNGDLNTLNEGISHLRDALALRPAPHPSRPLSLDNLARALLSHHERNGDIETLDEAIRLRRELLVLRPPGHRYRVGHVKRIAALLEIRFALIGDEADREEVQALQRELDEYESSGESGKDDGVREEDSNADGL
ncbi:hypothetical protein EST38_g6719 [Candolleomyces aberdarensis]|uniref:Nephrocystin 3-like N-terminal domain-containing protein n=1 Tax=Candolleomyces aberdarensis TaxID=2316362 RepID=A0A4Q2DIY2_9AGAR|nr:hypothetical protein EST38_g6719 [Candolleomyces aberdarensis]